MANAIPRAAVEVSRSPLHLGRALPTILTVKKIASASEYRKLPSVDELLRHERASGLLQSYPRGRVVKALRDALARARAAIKDGQGAPEVDAIFEQTEAALAGASAMSLRRVVNATGIILHTGLGRAVLCKEAVAALNDVARGHCALEIDIESGRRGSRQDHVTCLLTEFTGAESALVVNNNAAAVLLAVDTLARNMEVIISRGQLVEIGGSFRMPDVISRAGARLVEVGTTNRTRLSDYEDGLSENTGLIIRCHPSNFKICGFVEETPLEDLVALGQRYLCCHPERSEGSAFIPVLDDLGSGALIDFSRFGLEREPMVQDSVKAGADVVCFSGDKLLGASQAGILVGKAEVIEQCRSNPLARALRVDKLTLAALEATLRVYRDADPLTIPTLAAIARPLADIERAARRLARRINALRVEGLSASVVEVQSETGGGSLPGQSLESRAVALKSGRLSAEDLSVRFRRHGPPIFGRITKDVFVLDVRTVDSDGFTDITGCARGLVS